MEDGRNRINRGHGCSRCHRLSICSVHSSYTPSGRLECVCVCVGGRGGSESYHSNLRFLPKTQLLGERIGKDSHCQMSVDLFNS